MANSSNSDVYSFTTEEVSEIYQEVLELELDEDLDEEEWWGNYAPVFQAAKCWLSGDKDESVQLVHDISIPLLDAVCQHFDPFWDDSWTDALDAPDSNFGKYLVAIDQAFQLAGLLTGDEATLDRFSKFPLLTSNAQVVDGISCYFEGEIHCGAAQYAGVALDSGPAKDTYFTCQNFSPVRTGFDCDSAVFRIEHSDFKTPIGLVVKSYGSWTGSFFGEYLIQELGEALDAPDTQIPASIVLDGLQNAIELNKSFVVTESLGITGGFLLGDDEIEVSFIEDDIAVSMPGTYRTFALNTDYAEITLDDDGDIDWNESATLFINEKALGVLGLSAK